MSQFIMINEGFEEPTEEIMAKWGEFFNSISDRIVDMGRPLQGGAKVHKDGSIEDLPMGPDSLTGFTIFEAENLSEACEVVRNAPIIKSMRVYETMDMSGHKGPGQ